MLDHGNSPKSDVFDSLSVAARAMLGFALL